MLDILSISCKCGIIFAPSEPLLKSLNFSVLNPLVPSPDHNLVCGYFFFCTSPTSKEFQRSYKYMYSRRKINT